MTTDPGKNVLHKSISSTIEIQPLLASLAEVSEERDSKDDGDIENYLSPVGPPFSSSLLPASVGKAFKNTAALRGSVSSALYKFFCSFLI